MCLYIYTRACICVQTQGRVEDHLASNNAKLYHSLKRTEESRDGAEKELKTAKKTLEILQETVRLQEEKCGDLSAQAQVRRCAHVTAFGGDNLKHACMHVCLSHHTLCTRACAQNSPHM